MLEDVVLVWGKSVSVQYVYKENGGETYEDGFCHNGSGVCSTQDVEDQVSDDFIVSHEVGVFFFGPEEIVHVVFLSLELLDVLGAFDEGLDAESGGVREVGEFIGEVRVLSEEFV